MLSIISCICLRSHCSPSESSSRNSSQAQYIPGNPSHNRSSHPEDSTHDDGYGSEEGYTSIVPLPRYTPRPVSVNEKTLEAHMRDPPISSETYARDEKNLDLASDEVTSDVSSAISFPSSYGNTSTATRETPPPPYSPGPSPPVSRRMSLSESPMIAPPPSAHISHPPPTFYPFDLSSHDPIPRRFSSGHGARRFSWESQ
ncbi:hypothetical protein MPDQ_000517 [Monascus purpureus]|uniref:Uncharacterized protein n=1 Tax=Monascus purpureus TaxID=5098 RepID=A0A507R3T3_MONPU|nr:hypothetical protein MPDQ_000517 [Monascus purpureus]BDD64094.1 hypothetical protein MAP00_008941 [Monascus purpureus]